MYLLVSATVLLKALTFILDCSLQATWSTVLHMMMSSTTDGPLEPPVGPTCLWRTSNPTLGNTLAPALCLYYCVCMGIVHMLEERLSDLRYHLTHGSHRGKEPEPTNKDLLSCQISCPDLHVLFSIRLLPRVQVPGCGSRLFISVWECLYHYPIIA